MVLLLVVVVVAVLASWWRCQGRILRGVHRFGFLWALVVAAPSSEEQAWSAVCFGRWMLGTTELALGAGAVAGKDLDQQAVVSVRCRTFRL